MKVEMEMKYEAPAIDVLDVEVEVGFAASGVDPDGSQNEDGPIIP